MKNYIFTILTCLAVAAPVSAQDLQVASPDGKLIITVGTTGSLTWSVGHDGDAVLTPSEIGLKCQVGKQTVELGTLTAKDLKRMKVARSGSNFSFDTPFYKKSKVEDHYNALTVDFGKMAVQFRAYDDGAAYRIMTRIGKPFNVTCEKAEFRFAADYPAFIPYVNDNRSGERWCYSFESFYDETPLSKMYADSLAITPLAVCLPHGKKAVVMDAGVEDYPGMMLLKGKGNSLKADFAPYPLEEEISGYGRLNLVPTRRADYIARHESKAPYELPWRAVLVSTNDADLLNSDMAQRLAPACRLKDTSWIKPGKVAWDWWNNTNLTGVDFVAGMNTATYRYYIDFAARNHLEYIIIDEGWSGKESLLEDLNPEIDLQQLVDYGRQKGVGVILWSSWRNCIGDMERAMAHYEAMGVKGFKVDFFDRDDQCVIRSAYELAACAAKHHLLLDLHGLKPFGIQRAYPNIMNFEGVKGLENCKWEARTQQGPVHDFPRYDVTAPYLRMLPGPMDYTPGAMVNANRDAFFGNNGNPMSQGTRAHQLAMYVVYEAPLQMLADSPTKYEKEQECTDFIAQIPTTFDETIALEGEMGEYLVVARRKGSTWYVGGMTNWTARDITLQLDFLSEGVHQAQLMTDGINATRDARDYKSQNMEVRKGDHMHLHLAPGGGMAAIIK